MLWKYLSKRLIRVNPLTSAAWDRLINLPTPRAITRGWNYGRSLGACLIVQILTGVFLAIHYTGGDISAFNSVLHICEDVNYGWWVRRIHANGGSLFFVLIYLHVGRGLYYGGYYQASVWVSGVRILFILMATAFLGYVLPWGQISFWGATVITNLISAVPWVGETLVYWVWGGFAVGRATLTRFFTLHFLLPFVILALVLVHLISLHEEGSSNPLGVNSNLDKIPFHPYFSVKDMVGWVVLFGALLFVSLCAPWYLGDAENFIPANPLVTPVHIKPEWYFLFAYAILRSIPNKLGGVVALVISLVVLYLLPIKGGTFKPVNTSTTRKIVFWWFVGLFIILTWIGGNAVEPPFILIGQVVRVLYFGYFGVLILY